MSIYTNVSDTQMRDFLSQYNLGDFVSLQGIAQGITNSNYFLATSTGRYVLTVFEVLKSEGLPFLLELDQHLSQNDIACAAPIARKDGGLYSTLAEKSACLVTHPNGSGTDRSTEAQCFHTGAMSIKVHLAGQDFLLRMKSPRYNGQRHDACTQLLPVLDSEDVKLFQAEIAALDENLGKHLSSGTIHADLFKDNVLLNGNEVSGFIGSYYTCSSDLMYDLAIAVNDQARTVDNKLDSALYDASIHGYESICPLSDEECVYFLTAQRTGRIRFQVSHLLDFHFPQSGEMTSAKDPNVFRDLLLGLK